MIFCFSGTGNSRYLANRIAEALKDTVIDLNAKIKANDHAPVQTGRNGIVVVPTYAWRMPRIVSEWFTKTALIGAERIWFVMNCGSEIGNAAAYNRQLAQQKGLCDMGTAKILMPENYIAMFGVPQAEEARTMIKDAEPDIENVIAHIQAGQPFAPTRNNLYDRMMSGPVNPAFYRLLVNANAFRVKDNCVGCGLCVKKCPVNNVKLQNGKTVWGKACTHCMACICYCPVEAIEYGKRSVGKPRYHFEML